MEFDHQIVNQRVEEFEDRHGGRALAILHEARLYWPDGACRSVDKMGPLCDNRPTDGMGGENQVKKNQRFRLFFAKLKSQQLLSLFDQLRKKLKKKTDEAEDQCGIAPALNELDELESLRASVHEWQEKVETIELEMNPPRPPATAEQIARDAKIRVETLKFRDKLDTIEV